MGLPGRPFKCRINAKAQERGKHRSYDGYFEFSVEHFYSSLDAKWMPALILRKMS
jgi:hypothetical protein